MKKKNRIVITLALALGMAGSLRAQHVIQTVRAIDIKADTDVQGGHEGIRFFTRNQQLLGLFHNGGRFYTNLALNQSLDVGGNAVFSGGTQFRGVMEADAKAYFNNRVGIGTSNPVTGLHLQNKDFRIDNGSIQSWGALVFRPDVDNSGDDVVSFRTSTNREMAKLDDGDLFLRSFNATTGGIISSNGPLKLRPGNDGTGDDVVSFRTGSNEEMARLQNGVLTLDQVRLNVSTFPDYVFDSNYALMPLEDLEKFIEKNKHLPKMPSEQEVITSGMSVGEINLKLVEKVEELTLYLIQLKKEIAELKREKSH